MYYEGGASNAPETLLNYKMTRYLKTEADCAVASISDKTECAATVILSTMVRVNWPDLPIYNFYFDIPAWQTSYKNINFKFKRVAWKFEQWQKEERMDFTLMFVDFEDPNLVSSTNGSQTLGTEADKAQKEADAAKKYGDLLKPINSTDSTTSDTEPV